jgi:hypothetical protein
MFDIERNVLQVSGMLFDHSLRDRHDGRVNAELAVRPEHAGALGWQCFGLSGFQKPPLIIGGSLVDSGNARNVPFVTNFFTRRGAHLIS